MQISPKESAGTCKATTHHHRRPGLLRSALHTNRAWPPRDPTSQLDQARQKQSNGADATRSHYGVRHGNTLPGLLLEFAPRGQGHALPQVATTPKRNYTHTLVNHLHLSLSSHAMQEQLSAIQKAGVYVYPDQTGGPPGKLDTTLSVLKHAASQHRSSEANHIVTGPALQTTRHLPAEMLCNTVYQSLPCLYNKGMPSPEQMAAARCSSDPAHAATDLADIMNAEGDEKFNLAVVAHSFDFEGCPGSNSLPPSRGNFRLEQPIQENAQGPPRPSLTPKAKRRRTGKAASHTSSNYTV